jgi:predicted acyltransferase
MCRGLLSAWIDRTIFGATVAGSDLGSRGPAVHLPAIGTCLLGILAGRAIASPAGERLNARSSRGARSHGQRLVRDWVFPINKNLWSSNMCCSPQGWPA